jgi:hypothetical protein
LFLEKCNIFAIVLLSLFAKKKPGVIFTKSHHKKPDAHCIFFDEIASLTGFGMNLAERERERELTNSPIVRVRAKFTEKIYNPVQPHRCILQWAAFFICMVQLGGLHSMSQKLCSLERSIGTTDRKPCSLERNVRAMERTFRVTEQAFRSMERGFCSTAPASCSVEQVFCSDTPFYGKYTNQIKSLLIILKY